MVGTYTLGHVRLAQGQGMREEQLIRVEDGLIAEIREHPPGFSADIDGRGNLCLPGIVDLHCDALSREYRPRPGAQLPVDLAMQAAEGNLLAAGVTTAFHAVSFQAKSAVGVPINSPCALEVHQAVTGYLQPRMDHRILHRVDIRCETGMGMLMDVVGAQHKPLVAYEDHTPGQGQYRDRRVMERWLREAQNMNQQQASEHVDALIEERDQFLDFRERSLTRLAELAGDGEIRLMGHDPVTADEIEALVRHNAVIAEFPTTLEAARRAHALGIPSVAGAPNILLGKSHSGNVSALDLAKEGVLSILASDYLPSSMLSAAFEVARRGYTSLLGAINLITAAPASAAGLTDRGVITPGFRADLVLCAEVGVRPRVVRTLTAAEA